LRGRLDADKAAQPATITELNHSGYFCKQGVVFPSSYEGAWFETGAMLANQYRPSGHKLAGKSFDAEALRIAVPPIAGTADTFFMGHD
jgi:hypothetical protein